VTLILSHISRQGVLQTVDRLVTTTKQGKVSPYDDQSNKSIIFAARDAVVTLAYTGLSYIGQTSTDQWITETLQGEPVPLGPDGKSPATFSGRSRLDWPSLGEALTQLRDAVPSAMARVRPAWRKEPISIVVAGWQLYHRKPARPFVQIIHKLDVSGTVRVETAPRHLGRGLYLSSEPDGHLTESELRQLLKTLAAQPIKNRMATLVGAVRKVASSSSLVGAHCMCTVLPPTHLRWARVSYDSPTQAYGQLQSANAGIITMPVSFSPWVISRGRTTAPMVQAGSGTLELGLDHCTLTVESPKIDPPPGLVAYMGTQRRRPAPL